MISIALLLFINCTEKLFSISRSNITWCIS